MKSVLAGTKFETDEAAALEMLRRRRGGGDACETKLRSSKTTRISTNDPNLRPALAVHVAAESTACLDQPASSRQKARNRKAGLSRPRSTVPIRIPAGCQTKAPPPRRHERAWLQPGIPDRCYNLTIVYSRDVCCDAYTKRSTQSHKAFALGKSLHPSAVRQSHVSIWRTATRKTIVT